MSSIFDLQFLLCTSHFILFLLLICFLFFLLTCFLPFFFFLYTPLNLSCVLSHPSDYFRDVYRVLCHAAECLVSSPTDKERLPAMWRDLLRVSACMHIHVYVLTHKCTYIFAHFVLFSSSVLSPYPFLFASYDYHFLNSLLILLNYLFLHIGVLQYASTLSLRWKYGILCRIRSK